MAIADRYQVMPRWARLWHSRALLCWRRDEPVDSLSGAVSLAEDILLVGSAHCETLWSVEAVKPLAALIYVASPDGNARGMRWVAVLTRRLCETDTADGWLRAVASAAAIDPPWLYEWVRDVVVMEPRQRASVAIAMRDAVAAHMRRRR